ncbi:MAG: hypothetical protein ACJ735_11330 [Actinomycetes bacterium]
MGWEALFADLSGEFEAAEAAELAAEVDDRTRHLSARLRLVDRLRPAVGRTIRLHVAHLGAVSGCLLDVGPDWLLLGDAGNRQTLVPAVAVLAVSGLDASAAEPGTESVVLSRLRLGYVLRALARDRARVVVVLSDGSARTGTVERVGADHISLADQGGESGRPSIRDVLAVPFSAVVAVRSA